MISKQRNKHEFGGLLESTKSISTTTDTSGPEAGEGAEVQPEVPLVCQCLKETVSKKALHPTQKPALATPMPFQELRLPVFVLPRVNFFRTPFVPEGRGILQALSKTHPRTAQNTHIYSALALAR